MERLQRVLGKGQKPLLGFGFWPIIDSTVGAGSRPSGFGGAEAKHPAQQKIIIPNYYGEKLIGILHETGSVEIVILCHGFRTTKENETMVKLAVALEKEGIAAFRFDFSGNGLILKESEGSFRYGGYWRQVEDLRAVIQHFSSASRITSAILGRSKGIAF